MTEKTIENAYPHSRICWRRKTLEEHVMNGGVDRSPRSRSYRGRTICERHFGARASANRRSRSIADPPRVFVRKLSSSIGCSFTGSKSSARNGDTAIDSKLANLEATVEAKLDTKLDARLEPIKRALAVIKHAVKAILMRLP